MSTEKIVKRGFVKWTDEDGTFHKEPLHEHPDLLAKASVEQQIAAEEVKRGIAAAEEFYKARDEEGADDAARTLEALKAAPADVTSASQLVETQDENGKPVIVEATAAAEPVSSKDLNDNHNDADTGQH